MIVQGTVGALAIVEGFDVIEDLALGLGTGIERAAISQLEFEGAPEAFHGGIIVAVAIMESFWATLKLELVYRRCFQTRTQARTEIFDYIETFYNRQRLHSALNYHSPVDFELKNN